MFPLDVSHQKKTISPRFRKCRFTSPSNAVQRFIRMLFSDGHRAAFDCVFEAIESMGLGPPSMLFSHPPATPGCQAWSSSGPHRTREFDRSINNLTALQSFTLSGPPVKCFHITSLHPGSRELQTTARIEMICFLAYPSRSRITLHCC